MQNFFLGCQFRFYRSVILILPMSLLQSAVADVVAFMHEISNTNI